MKRGLVIEGGGMRSAYVSGALVALQELGDRHFDVVVGTSAGACCAVNFVGGFAQRNFEIIHDHLANDRFIRYKKAFTRENVVDIDFLLDEVIQQFVPLPVKEVRAGSTRVFITATDCNTGEPVYFDAHRDDVVEALRASCAMPYLYRRKIIREDRRLMDGGVSVSIPLQKVIEEGCDEIVVISTRPIGYRKKKNPMAWLNYVFFPRYPRMVKMLNERWKEYNETLEWLENPPPTKKVVLIRPKEKLPITRTTRDRAKIRKGFEMGYEDTMEILGEKSAGRNRINRSSSSPQ
jgi:predicted patatin/cPLA2 family phospholipase